MAQTILDQRTIKPFKLFWNRVHTFMLWLYFISVAIFTIQMIDMWMLPELCVHTDSRCLTLTTHQHKIIKLSSLSSPIRLEDSWQNGFNCNINNNMLIYHQEVSWYIYFYNTSSGLARKPGLPGMNIFNFIKTSTRFHTSY